MASNIALRSYVDGSSEARRSRGGAVDAGVFSLSSIKAALNRSINSETSTAGSVDDSMTPPRFATGTSHPPTIDSVVAGECASVAVEDRSPRASRSRTIDASSLAKSERGDSVAFGGSLRTMASRSLGLMGQTCLVGAFVCPEDAADFSSAALRAAFGAEPHAL
ncbi:hypothetical protein N7474_002455 [Penicillium riverlandense]|uniref:uncharacterized protein n=1 Tax=Penicillium riverlandense TaxID=1903569 RepID=UPI0025497CA5|nr:uncharacterized protein N7474_002455 [Penicillium riverlandense]KAJ5825317.1 hypothetical protein N7474_002455 [Penicillium riverlandense]